MSVEPRCAGRAPALQPPEAGLATSLELFRRDLDAFSLDGVNEYKYRDALDCLRKVTMQIEAALHWHGVRVPDAPTSGAELRFKETVIHNSEELLVHSQRILSEMRELTRKS